MAQVLTRRLVSKTPGCSGEHQKVRPTSGPRVVVTERAQADRLVREALSALQGLFASVGRYLEQVLRARDAPMGHGVANAFILEARRELDELAACRTANEVYVEDLTITESGDKSQCQGRRFPGR